MDKHFIVCLPFVEQSGGQKNVVHPDLKLKSMVNSTIKK
jgi:hypothetical protein